jgi:hypothetical protein
VLDLVAVIRLDAALGVDAVALGQVEQRTRADRNDELAFEGRSGQAASILARNARRRGARFRPRA